MTITGTGFSEAAQVYFGNALAQAITIGSSTEITATSPPGQSGQPVVDVSVHCNESVSPVVAADQFTYIAASIPSSNSPVGS